MRRFMRLDEAIERKIVKNLDKVDPNALFPKSPNNIILKTIFTGSHRTQEIQRQDFDYVFFKTRVNRDIKLSILAIGKKETRNASVELCGEIGYYCHSFCWEDINKLYSNRSNGITAYPIREEELNLLFERNKKFKGFEFATWIEESFRDCISGDNFTNITKNGIKFVRKRTIFKKVLWYSSSHILTGKLDYCPYIHIWGPEYIIVDLTSMKKTGKWRLIPRKGLLKWRYKLY